MLKRKTPSPRVDLSPTVSSGPVDAKRPAARSLAGFWLGALLFCSVFAAYSPAINGAFLWDDDGHVTPPALRSAQGLARIWFEVGASQQYYPLLHTAFWVEHKMWGDSPLGYHVMNLLLHASAACLVALILRRLAVPGAWLAAFLFALHPVHVESVAWITEQKNTLSLVFYLLASLCYLRFDEQRRRSWYVFALTFFVAGLLTKTVTATLPAALLVVFWWQRGRLEWKRDARPLLPWLALGVAGGLFTAWVERAIIGAEGAAFELGAWSRALLAGRVVWFYLGKLFWPVDLMFFYPRWTIDPAVPWQYLFPGALIVLLAGLWGLRRRWRGPLAGLLFFAGSLFPVLGFLNVYPFIFSFVADHFQYLPSLGVITLTAAGLTLGAKRLPGSLQGMGQAGLILLITALGAMTWRHSRIYRNPETLYQTTFERNAGAWMTLVLQSVLRYDQGRLEEAIRLLEQAIRINPASYEAHHNLGIYLREENRLDEAIAHYERAIQIAPQNAQSYINLGAALSSVGRKQDALARLEEVRKLEPDLPLIRHHLGALLNEMGRSEEAIVHFRHALQIDPGYNEVRYNLGVVLARLGRMPEAIVEFKRVLERDPSFALAHYNLALSLAATGRAGEGFSHYQEARRLNPALSTND